MTEQTSDQTEDVNCEPLSEVRRAGIPNLETQVNRNTLAKLSVEMLETETAFGQCEVQSIIVSK